LRVEKRDGILWADIYWDDLTANTQAELLRLMGENGNYDVFPLASISVTPEDGDEHGTGYVLYGEYLLEQVNQSGEELTKKSFTVNVTEKNHGFAVIEAEDKDEAEELALEVYNEGNFNWTTSSLSEFEVKEGAGCKSEGSDCH
jgi:hypothetical protein